MIEKCCYWITIIFYFWTESLFPRHIDDFEIAGRSGTIFTANGKHELLTVYFQPCVNLSETISINYVTVGISSPVLLFK